MSADGMIRSFEDLRAPGARCAQCGYEGSMPLGDVRTVVAEAPRRYAALLEAEPDATRRPAPDVWSPSAYLWHVVDAVGIWAERLAAVVLDGARSIVPFDQERLSEARGYDRLSTAAGLWALARRAHDFDTAARDLDVATTVEHPEEGSITVAEAIRWVGHEVHHHERDVRNGLARAGAQRRGL